MCTVGPIYYAPPQYPDPGNCRPFDLMIVIIIIITIVIIRLFLGLPSDNVQHELSR